MRRLIVALSLSALLTIPSNAATTKATISDLNTLLINLNQQQKSDDAIATRLKDVQLTEQLTAAGMNNLMQSKPGPATLRQLELPFIESSMLPPPSTDLPTAAAPDSTAQAAILHRAQDYAAQVVAHLPRLTLQKQTLRFQNGLPYVRNDSGNGSAFGNPNNLTQTEQVYLSLMSDQTDSVTSEAGAELSPPPVKQKDPASPSGQVSIGVNRLSLGVVLADAAKGPITWLRWQTIGGRQIAVFSFAVKRKGSQYKVNYCCFPSMDAVGSGMHFADNSGSVSTFAPFKAAPGYHGELYIEPDTGAVVRLITKADLRPTDFVLQEDIRVDYSPILIGGSPHVVPTRSMILTTVVPNGDSYVKFSTRRTIFDVDYSGYKLASTSTSGN